MKSKKNYLKFLNDNYFFEIGYTKKESKLKSDVKEEVYDWETLAQEVGVEATDEQSFKEAVANAMNKPAPVNDTIQILQGFLKMSDMDLVKSDLQYFVLQLLEMQFRIEY